MFYYYGRKKQIARHYPAAKRSTIIEPFAGSAAYSLFSENWKRNVLLVEKDARVASLWDWLICEATAEKILALPDARVGETSTEFFHIIHAATKQAFAYRTIKITPILERNWEISRRVMAKNIHKVKHWKLIHGDYTSAPDVVATWFIDPPYRSGPGMGYQQSSAMLDYGALAAWTLRRKGQIICCEGEYGNYLPFQPLLDLPGVAGKRSKEKLYVRTNTVQDQIPIFFDDINLAK